MDYIFAGGNRATENQSCPSTQIFESNGPCVITLPSNGNVNYGSELQYEWSITANPGKVVYYRFALIYLLMICGRFEIS